MSLWVIRDTASFHTLKNRDSAQGASDMDMWPAHVTYPSGALVAVVVMTVQPVQRKTSNVPIAARSTSPRSRTVRFFRRKRLFTIKLKSMNNTDYKSAKAAFEEQRENKSIAARAHDRKKEPPIADGTKHLSSLLPV